jgi:hypothetical protein
LFLTDFKLFAQTFRCSVSATFGNFYVSERSPNYNESEQNADDGAEPFSGAFEPRNPNVVAKADSMESRPETVVEVKPQSGEPNKVNNHEENAQVAVVKIPVNPVCAVCREFRGSFAPGEFGEHHFSPELSEVN